MKKTALHAALLAIIAPMSVYGLGLGQMTVKSALDQPFLAEIELVDPERASLKDVKVGIADPENFAEIGLERAAILSLLNFQITKNANGKDIIIIRSTERMTEPYMELVVDLIWPEGQLYKSYTVLLDPPGYRLVTTTIKGSTTHYKNYSKHANEPGVINKTVVTTVTHNPTSIKDNRKQSTYGPTVTNENVWQIAQRYKSSDLILPQVVLSIVGANPDAFNEGNLNGLKVGERLMIPSSADMSKVPSELATAEVMAHDKAWNSKTPIEHVLTPPYAQERPQTENNNSKGAVSTLSATNSVVPPLPSGGTESNLIPNSTISSIPTTSTQIREQNVTNKTELSITASAIESVREVNSLLVEQLRLIQKQNLDLQKQLEDRNKTIAKLNSQVQLLMKQRQALPSQASSAKDSEESSLWPYFLLLIAAATGFGFAYWFLRRRNTDEVVEEEPPSEAQANFITPREEPPSTPNLADENEKSELMVVEPKELIVTPVIKTQTAAHDSQVLPEEENLHDFVEQAKQTDEKPEDAHVEPSKQSAPELIEEAGLVEEEPLKWETELTPSEQKPVEESKPEQKNEEEEVESGAPLEFVSYVVSEEKVSEDEKRTKSEENISNQEGSVNNQEENFLEFESGLHTNLPETTDSTINNEEKDNSNATQTSGDELLELDGLELEGLDFELANEDTSGRIDDTPEELEFEIDEDLSQFFLEESVDNTELDYNQEGKDQEIEGEEDTEVAPLKSKKALDTQIALARTYISMDDFESARYSLEEVLEHGSKKQKEEASSLLESIKDK